MKRADLLAGMEVYYASASQWNWNTEDIDKARAIVIETTRYGYRSDYDRTPVELSNGNLVKLELPYFVGEGTRISYQPLARLRGPYSEIAAQRRTQREIANRQGQVENERQQALRARRSLLISTARTATLNVGNGRDLHQVSMDLDTFTALLTLAGITVPVTKAD